MNLDEKKKNLDLVAEHFKKFPHILQAIQSCPENMEWVMGCDDMDEAVSQEKEEMDGKKPITSMEELRNRAKESEAE